MNELISFIMFAAGAVLCYTLMSVLVLKTYKSIEELDNNE